MNIIKLPPKVYLDMIRENKPFSFIRVGDGEILCCYHSTWLKENCDGSKFTDDLIEPMKQIFKNQYNYFHCLLECSFDPVFKQETDQFCAFIEDVCPNMPFYDGEVWQELSFSGRITEITEAIASYEPCFIGAEHLKNVVFIHGMGDIHFIEIPKKDAFSQFEHIKEAILRKHSEGCRLFAFSAGYSTKILIDTLFPLIGDTAHLIDFGSVFDPYCGVLSRSGMVDSGFGRFQPFTKMKLV